MAGPAFKQVMYVGSYAELPASAETGQLCMDMTTSTTYLWNGTSWAPSARVIIKKELNSVNGKTTGAVLIYTLEQSSLNFYPFAVVPRATGVGVSGVVTGPTISIGANATAYNNIATASLMANVLSTLTGGSSLSANVNSPALAGGTNIFANVTVGAVATNYTMKYDILGYYDV